MPTLNCALRAFPEKVLSGRIYVVSEVDIKPFILKKGKLDTKGSRIAYAKAQVAVLVGEYGQIISTEIAYAKSDEFAKIAIDAAKKCEFEPAIKDDKLVKCLIILPVSYISEKREIDSSDDISGLNISY